ncbi:hypothetical protein D3C84_732920 [compost metagenome]
MGQAAVQATRLHLGIDEKCMARAAAIVLHRPIVITADMAQAVQAVGAEQHPVLEKRLLRADMPAGETVQGRLARDVQGLAFGTHVNEVEPTRTTVRAQADAIDQNPLLQPILLHHQGEPGE